ncbi:MAG: hypothetical protein OXE44_18770 [Nitrospinae bacterium]|nr:hypothetical protein [Nitrospinota bacterium]
MGINRCRTLEDQIRKLKRDMSAILRRLDQLEEKMDKRFDGLESRIDSFENKTGRSFLALTKPLEVHCGSEGAEATRELKEIWKDDS